MPTYGDNTTSNSRYFQKGVFVDKAKIVSVEDYSNYPKRPSAEIKTMGQNNWAPQICLKLIVDTGIEMKMNVLGNFNYKKDPISGKQLEYIGWRQQSNGVQNLIFKLLGKFDTDENDGLAQATLDALVGKEFYKLRYCQPRDKMYEGRPSTQTWWKFETAVEGNDDVLYREFLKANLSPKKYDPNLWDDFQDEQKQREESFDPSKIEEDVI